jgi:hypothetical protein
MVNDDRLQSGSADERFAALLSAYREACPDPEPGPDFMPGLWRKIEGRRTFSFAVRRLAQGIITAAAVASLAMGVYLTQIQPRIAPTYLETLAAGPTHDSLADTEIVAAVHENSR